eukprot:734542-Rhodomonas_salina.1
MIQYQAYKESSSYEGTPVWLPFYHLYEGCQKQKGSASLRPTTHLNFKRLCSARHLRPCLTTGILLLLHILLDRAAEQQKPGLIDMNEERAQIVA